VMAGFVGLEVEMGELEWVTWDRFAGDTHVVIYAPRA
jgi:hypothetical protein